MSLTQHQQRHWFRVRLKLLKRELLHYKQLRGLGISLYPNAERLPA